MGFFFGKDVTHTWRKDIQERLADHFYTHTQSTLTCQIRPTLERSEPIKSQVISLFVGENYLQMTEKVLTNHPFEVELLFNKWK